MGVRGFDLCLIYETQSRSYDKSTTVLIPSPQTIDGYSQDKADTLPRYSERK